MSKYLRSKHGTQPQVVGIVGVSVEKEIQGRALTVAEPLPIRVTRRGHWSLCDFLMKRPSIAALRQRL